QSTEMNYSLSFILISTILFFSASAQPRCARNEVYRECSTMCEAKCGEDGVFACVMMCGPPKCQCDNGFFRHRNGQCVTQSQC
ncbi:hypothetical protein PENTCL1PPCAC_4050, partial [Pristionchus entomophagus]